MSPFEGGMCKSVQRMHWGDADGALIYTCVISSKNPILRHGYNLPTRNTRVVLPSRGDYHPPRHAVGVTLPPSKGDYSSAQSALIFFNRIHKCPGMIYRHMR
jgi:hypothetical protein